MSLYQDDGITGLRDIVLRWAVETKHNALASYCEAYAYSILAHIIPPLAICLYAFGLVGLNFVVSVGVMAMGVALIARWVREKIYERIRNDVADEVRQRKNDDPD